MRLLLVCSLIVLAACSTAPNASTRPVQGHLSGLGSSGAIVIAEGLDSSQTSTAVTASGGFRLNLPVNEAVRLSLAVPMSNGAFLRRAQIGPAWFTVAAGGTLDLGEISVGEASAGSSVVRSAEVAAHTCPARAVDAGRHAEGDDDQEKDDRTDRDGKSDAGVSLGRDHDGQAGDVDKDGDDDDGARRGDDLECERVEVDGCSTEHARCEHERELEPAEGRADVCTGAGSAVDGGTSTPSAIDGGPGLG